MAGSKVVLLGLSLAVFLMIASEVTARELAETTTTVLHHLIRRKLRRQMGLPEMTSTTVMGTADMATEAAAMDTAVEATDTAVAAMATAVAAMATAVAAMVTVVEDADTVAAATAPMEGAKGAAHTRGKRPWMRQSPKL
nr:cold and drought-regulated protein CORA-like isoform X2 [Ipomoea trifida]